jgi:cytochrome c553
MNRWLNRCLRAWPLMPSFALIACLGMTACGGDSGSATSDLTQPGDPLFVRSPALDVTLQSSHGTSVSHNVGQNCMRCHQAHGPGLGQFTAAGTLRNLDGSAHPNGTLILTRTDPAKDPTGGDVVAAVDADALGNFYTTAPLPVPDEALYALVRSADGATQNWMPFPTITTACNICHAGSNVLAVAKKSP